MPEANPSFRSAATSGEPLETDHGFSGRVRSAMAWRWGTQVLAQIITWGSTLAVVRLLDPSDYGLFAMTQVVLAALAFLNGYSFATSLIQAPQINGRKVSQVFGMLILANGLIASAQFLLAPYIAAYYGQPVVADMLRVQAALFLTVPFIALPSALLARKIEFRNQGLVNLVSAAAGAGVALWMAWRGYGVWALVFAPIAMAITRALGLTIAARLLVWPSFDFRGARDILTFGGALTLCQLFWIIQSQSDIFIAGRAFDTHELGLYSEALFLTLIVTGRFLPPINEVAFPAYAELHKLGKPLAPFFLRTLRTVLLVTAPIYIGLALTADAAVLTLFGPKWSEMAPIAAGLAIAMPLMALQIVCSPATNAMGTTRIYVTTSAIGAVVYPAVFLIGIASGPMGLVHAWWVAAPTLLAATLALTLPAVGLSLGELLAELLPVALACAVMAGVVAAVQAAAGPVAAPMQLLLTVPAGALAYGVTLWLGWPPLLRETWAMLRKDRQIALTA
ncbi:lipopolysaccharide biosynthesis protein [Allopontixanthobacter sp.]|uniref:lipopolysaccharide biosynthesis protein n=1 Tax=Allopontixanthobacter sp. TaxID=2906452 RepID=UPI002AB8DA85|nr:lipopolysaccharide biosynthesis protein [Allopontixanthobacter sp.]MDZ4306702.1 lipopolysaccharide biosynthesis protein [Allopontixanthobacter sp.]